MESDINKEKNNSITYKKRKVSVIPYGINKVIKEDHWKLLIRYAVEESTKLAYLGSTLVNLNLLRLLETNQIDNYDNEYFNTEANLRSWYVSVSNDSKPPKDKFLNETIKLWLKIFPDKDKIKLPILKGLQIIVNGQTNQYYNIFVNYHTIAIVNHYSWYIYAKYDNISKKSSQKIAKQIFSKKLSQEEIDEMQENEEEIKLNETEIKIIEDENKLIENYNKNSLIDRIKLHYKIQKDLNQYNDTKTFSIAPICTIRTRFININKDGLKKLYELCKSIVKTSKKVINTNNKSVYKKSKRYSDVPISYETAFIVSHEKIPTKIDDILDDNKLNRKQHNKNDYDYSLEFKTNGIEVKFVWEKIIEITIKLNDNEYNKYIKNKEKYEEQKKEKIDKQILEKGYLDKRSIIERAPKIEKNKGSWIKKTPFDDEKNGFFSKTSIINSTIKPGTLITANDPGHKNIITSVKAVYQDDISKMEFKKGYTLSLGGYYEEIGHRKYNNKLNEQKKHNNRIRKIELKWSKNSIKKNNLEEYKTNLKIQLEDWFEYSSFYRKRNFARLNFHNTKKKQRLMKKIKKEMAPNKDTIIVNGSAKFATSRPGLSATPVAKIFTELGLCHIIAITPEQFTTCRCSSCLDNEEGKECSNMKNILGNNIWVDKDGIEIKKTIHGLKHCTKCGRLWSRDLNAAINIGKAFLYLNKYGKRPYYLTKMAKSDDSTARSVCTVEMNKIKEKEISYIHSHVIVPVQKIIKSRTYTKPTNSIDF